MYLMQYASTTQNGYEPVNDHTYHTGLNTFVMHFVLEAEKI